MQVYVFTFGTDEKFAYRGGWTIVKAPDMQTATALFRAVHPDATPGVLNCAGVYSGEQFRKKEMYERGNYGARCHEVISLRRFEEGTENE